jgi:type IV secretory pathway VirB4 component
MSRLSELLKKAPQSIKDRYNSKIRDNAIQEVKKKIIKLNKKISDYSDEEIEIMIKEEEARINETVKISILTTLLVTAGIKLSFFS